MSNGISHLRDYVESQYQEMLGISLQDHRGILADWKAPVWQLHDKNLEPSRGESTATGAVIADPAIGLCLLVQVYSDRFDPTAQIRKALQYRSELLPARNIAPRLQDENGDWRVALHWLVEAEDEKRWIEQVSFLRQETAYFEEVPVDAIFNLHNDWPKAIAAHGLPRLLFHVRQTLKKSNIDESLQWASADSRIEQYIRAIPDLSSNDQEQHFSDLLIREVDRLKSTASSKSRMVNVDEDLLILNRIRIENFRNIERLEVELGSLKTPVSSHIFQGPNGSGKSSIVEALSLASVGISNRYLEYSSDSNVLNRHSMENYVSSYLRPLGPDKSALPLLGINGDEATPIKEPDSGKLESSKQKLRSSFLCQLGRTDFLARSAGELGREVAQSFSTISSQSFSFVSREYEKSSGRRKAFNRSWNIQSTITRIGTAQSRILEQIIDKYLRPIDGLDDWLRNSIHSRIPAFQAIADLSELWQEWRTKYRNLLDQASKRESIEGDNLLRLIWQEYNDCLGKTYYVLQQFVGRTEEPPDGIEELVEKYAEWLVANRDYPTESYVGSEVIEKELDDADRQIIALDEKRTDLLARRSHLLDTSRYLERHWVKGHADTCPTCETDLSEYGGVVPVIGDHLLATGKTLAEVEKDHKEISVRIASLSKQKAKLDNASRPASPEDLAELMLYINRNFGLTGDIDALLGDQRKKDDILSALQVLRTIPNPVKNDQEVKHEELLEAALSEYVEASEEFRRVSAAPDSWKEIEKRLVQAQSTAVKEHLPITVQALWREIALNLASAPWQFPALAEMRVSSYRGETQARIILEGSDSLAAHILNGAEVYNLSLAWFLTRYLTTGRFQLGFFVLDDPAQQMDQPTFRDLCRLLESLMRLHRIHGYRLMILTFLHQDSRALDAAKATNGTLHFLRWNRKGTAVLQESMRMRQDDFVPPFPEKILAAG